AHQTGGPPLEPGPRRTKGGVLLFPGCEEDLESETIPRLIGAGADLNQVTIMDDHDYSLPTWKEKIADAAFESEAGLILFDPIDSYAGDNFNENDGPTVRTFLEAVVWIVHRTGVPVVAVRHPGKEKGNIMPGSRQWGAVPRRIIKMEENGDMPPRGVLS